MSTSRTLRAIGVALAATLFVAACSSDPEPEVTSAGDATTTVTTTLSTDTLSTDTVSTDTVSTETVPTETVSITAEVWADNWFALWVNGELVGEDSVPITTERSFNAETFVFEATFPLTIAIEAKDFKETDSGIEYIGEANQQMGDGGLIAQFTETESGTLIAATAGDWQSLVVHQAPLNPECERDVDPDATCEFEITDVSTDWAATDFDDSAWASATTWSEADVGPKDGYDEISWNDAAALIWGTDLEIDNTVLFRTTVG